MLTDKRFWIGFLLALVLALFFNPLSFVKGAVTPKSSK